MKRTSFVLLIIAAVLCVGGVVLCLYASRLSEQTGVSLYDTTTEVREADGARIYDFTAKEITRIKVAMQDTEIRILKSESEKSYVELYNFSTGTFDVGVSNRLLTVTNQSGLSTLFGDEENRSFSLENISFKGLRYYLRFTFAREGKPRADIYLADNSSVKIIDISTENGSVLVKDQKLSADYSIKSAGGDMTFENVLSDSTVSLTAENAAVSLKNTALSTCGMSVKNGGFTGSGISIGIMTAEISGGDASFDMTAKLGDYRYFVKTPSGMVTIDGKEIGKRSSTEAGFGYLQIVNNTGNVKITSGTTATDALGIKIDEKLVSEKIKNLDDSLGKNEYE